MDARRFYVMAKSGVPLTGILMQMRLAGFTEESQDTFKAWYLESTGVDEETSQLASQTLSEVERRSAFQQQPTLQLSKATPSRPVPSTRAPRREHDSSEKEGKQKTNQGLSAKEIVERVSIALGKDWSKIIEAHKNSDELLQVIEEEQGIDCLAMAESMAFTEAVIARSREQETDGDVELDEDPEYASPILVNTLLLRDFALQVAEDETLDDAMRQFTQLVRPWSSDRVLRMLRQARLFLQLAQSANSPAVLADSLLEYFASVKDSHTVALPLQLHGTTRSPGFVTLLVSGKQNHFLVRVCTKDAPAYHPQSFTPNGKLKIVPVLSLERVENHRILDPTFALMLARFMRGSAPHSTARVLYEVLLPFLAGRKPLQQAAARLYGGKLAEDEWWTSPAEQPSPSPFSSFLIAIRCMDSFDLQRWRHTKLSLKTSLCKLISTGDVEFDSVVLESIVTSLARSEAKARGDNTQSLSSDITQICFELSEAAQEKRSEERQKARFDHAASQWPVGRKAFPSLIDPVTALKQCKPVVQALQLCRTTGLLSQKSMPSCLSPSNALFDRAATIPELVHGIHAIVVALRGEVHQRVVQSHLTTLAIIQHAVSDILPADPETWMSCAELKVATTQQRVASELLDLAVYYIDASLQSLPQCHNLYTADGDRAVVLAALYAFANAILLRPDSSSNNLSGLLPDCTAFNGSEFHSISARLPMDPSMALLRARIAPFLCSDSPNRVLWNFAAFRSKQTQAGAIPQLLKLAAERLGLDDSATLSDCTHAFCQKIDTVDPLFATVRDIAVVVKYGWMPLPATSSNMRKVSRSVSWDFFQDNESVAIFATFFGEDLLHDFSVSSRHFVSDASPIRCLPEDTILKLTPQADEHDVLCSPAWTSFQGYMSATEVERFASFLTVPFLRIAALVNFFQAEHRASMLFNPAIRRIFLAALLEPHLLDLSPETREKDVLEGSFSCPALDRSDCMVHPKFVSLLGYEMSEHAGETGILFVELVHTMLSTCASSASVPGTMMMAVLDVALVLAGVEHLEMPTPTKEQVISTLREHLVPFFKLHGLVGACVACFSGATRQQVESRAHDLLLWAVQFMNDEDAKLLHPRLVLHVQRFLACHATLFVSLPLPAEELSSLCTELIGRSVKHWEQSGFLFSSREGAVTFNLLTGEISVQGSFQTDHLPSALVAHQREVGLLLGPDLGTRKVPRCLLVDPEEMARLSLDTIDTSVELYNDYGDRLQLSTHLQPLFSDSGEQNQESMFTQWISEEGDAFVVPSSNEDSHEGLELPHLSAILHLHSDADKPHLVHIPRAALLAYVPSGLLGGPSTNFWLDVETNVILASVGEFLGSQGFHFADLRIDLGRELIHKPIEGLELELDPPKVFLEAFSRLDDDCYILFWRRAGEETLAKVEFTRLGVVFSVDGDTICLADNPSLVFQPDLDQKLASSETLALVGLERFLVLVNVSQEEYALCREEGSCEGIMRPVLVKIDVTRSVLHPQTRIAALSLFLTKLENKAFNAALDLIDYLSTDEPFSQEEWHQMARLSSIRMRCQHPDAVACRLHLFASTFLRNGSELPKHVSVFADCFQYALCEDLVRPRLRLPPHKAVFVVNAALKQGRPKLKQKRMALSAAGRLEGFSTDYQVKVLEAFSTMQQLHGDPTTQRKRILPTCVPLHGGGGWHRLQATAMSWAEDAIEDGDSWVKSCRMPVILVDPGISMDLSKVGDLEALDRFLATVFECDGIDVLLPFLLGLFAAEDSSGLALNLAELVVTKMYILKQDSQGTPFFETASFYILALLVRGLHTRGISMPPRPPWKSGAIINYCYSLLKFLVKNLPGPAASPIDIPTPPAQAGVPSRLKTCSFFQTKPSCILPPVPKRLEPPVLLDWHIFGLLLQSTNPNRAKHPKRTEPSKAALLREIEKNSALAKDRLNRLHAVHRLQKSLREFNEQRKQTEFTLVSNPATWSIALGLIKVDLEIKRNKIIALVSSLQQRVQACFARQCILSFEAPTIGFRDLCKLFVSEEGRCLSETINLPLDDLCDLLELATAFQLQGQVFASLQALGTAHAHGQGTEKPLQELVTELLSKRRYHQLDPTYLVFEYEQGFLLRKSQVEMLHQLQGPQSSCRQMQMGGGKSSAVIPLLGLRWATSATSRLTVLLVPESLMQMSATMLMKAYAGTFGNQLVHFQFSRYSFFDESDTVLEDAARLLDQLRYEAQAGSVVVATGSSLKAFILKTVEHLGRSSDPTSHLNVLLGQILDLFRDGNIIIDECDVLLHPLRSELNFPFGPKEDLAQSGWRVTLARTLLSTLHEPSKALRAVLDRGTALGKLENMPHLVLVDEAFYKESLCAHFAKAVAELVVQMSHDRNLTLEDIRDVPEATASSELDDAHSVSNLLNNSASFWCTQEFPSQSSIEFVFKSPLRIAAVDISFRQFSSFIGRSGASMIPSHVSVQVMDDATRSFRPVSESVGFVKRRLYVEPLEGVRCKQLRIVLDGNARWFAINQIKFFASSVAGEAKGAQPTTRWPWSILPKKKSLVSNKASSRSPEEQLEILEQCILRDSSNHQDIVAAVDSCGMHRGCVDLVEMGTLYVHHYLPHCMQKVHSVSHGLLPQPSRSESAVRRYMSVPYLGKDTPSKAAEFSHPDILILLTLLAFQHGGLRRLDAYELVTTLKNLLVNELGPFTQRPSWVKFDDVVHSASGSGEPILPLHLFDANDSNQVENLWLQVMYSSVAIQLYCDLVVFPKCLKHRTEKLSATGEELVYPVAQVHGFSGTPNSALPLKLGNCIWESATEGRFLHTLTSKDCVPHVSSSRSGTTSALTQSTPEAILRQVALSDQGYCALIDTGALITGLSNTQVAEFLLRVPGGLQGKKGVVYIGESGEKMILTRTEDAYVFRSMPLETCPLPIRERFTYYDQIHTTGMDIAQPPSGTALITVGKDVNFRDFAQGAYRMRRLGNGQKVSVLASPAVLEMMKSTLSRHALADLSKQQQLIAYLYLKGLRDYERMEHALKVVQPRTIWRKGALDKIHQGRSSSKIRDLIFAAFYSRVTFEGSAQSDVPKSKSSELETESKRFKQFITTKEQKQQLKSFISNNRGRMKLLSSSASPTRLDSEQQQEREQEQQSETMEMFEEIQERSWAGSRRDVVHWPLLQTLEDGQVQRWCEELGTISVNVGTKELRLEHSGEVGIYFSVNHTPQSLGVRARLKNVEVCLCLGKNIVIIDLEEAGTIRWASQFGTLPPHSLVFAETMINSSAELAMMTEDTSKVGALQLARFFNGSSTFSEAQLELVADLVRDTMSPVELELFYSATNKLRRRETASEGAGPLQRVLDKL